MRPTEVPRRWRDDPARSREVELLRPLLDEPPPTFEARLWTRIKATRRNATRLVWAIIPATAALLVLGLVFAPRLRTPPSPIELAFAEGVVHISDAASISRDVGTGAEIPMGVALHSRRGRSVMRVRTLGTLLLANNTRVTLGHSIEVPVVQLDAGRLVAVVETRKGHAPFTVAAGDYAIKVLGTAFEVQRCAGVEIAVRVWEGNVHVVGPDGSLSLRAGEHLPCATETSADRHADVALAWRLALRAGPAPSAETLQQVHFARSAPPAEPPAVAPTEPIVTTPPDKPSARLRRHEPKVGRGTAPTSPETTDEREEALYQRAIVERDPRRAIALFDAVSALAGRRATLAAYQAARLSMKLDLAAAARRFEAFVVNEPDDVLAEEARISLVECRLALGQLAEAEKALDPLLGGASRRTGELHFLRAEIARQLRHDCTRALADYETALTSGRRGEDALYYKAWCLYELGREADGRRALEQYLESFPKGRHEQAARRRLGLP